MAGRGSRFLKAGVEVPKPLIPVEGKTLVRWAVDSLRDLRVPYEITFAVLQEHVDQFQIDRTLAREFPGCSIFRIPRVTRGASETAYLASENVDPLSALLVMDCDLWFRSAGFGKRIEESVRGDPGFDGLLVTFRANHPRYSFAELQGDLVLRTAEKVAISDRAIAGAYFFATADLFRNTAGLFLAESLAPGGPGEYYMSMLFNRMIEAGKTIWAANADEYRSFGTPEEIESEAQAGQKK